MGQYDFYGQFIYDVVFNLHEKSYQHWTYEFEDERQVSSKLKGQIIVTPDHCIEECLILVAYEIEKQADFIDLMNKLLKRKHLGRLDMFEELDEDQRKRILTHLKTIEFKHHFIFMNIDIKQAKALQHYKLKARYLIDINIKLKN